MPNSAHSDIESLIEQFTAQLTALVRQSTLNEMMATLGGDVPWPGVLRKPGRPAGSGAKRGRPAGSKNKPKSGGRIRRSSEDLAGMQDALLAHVKANPGMRGDQIASALGSDVKTIRGPMKMLIAAKQIRTEGQRRGMTYHVGGGKKKGRK